VRNKHKGNLSTYYKYWGKAKKAPDPEGPDYHLLVYHSLDVAACGWLLLSDEYRWTKELAGSLGISPEQLRRLFVFFLCLHDLGKFARAFQGQVEGLSERLVTPIAGMPYTERHDSLGYWLWRESEPFQTVLAQALGVTRQEVRRSTQLHTWFEIVTGHHGQPPKQPNLSTRLLAHFDRSDIEAACAFLEELMLWKLECEDLAVLQDKQVAKRLKRESWKLAGLAVLADWLGSNQKYFEYCINETPLQSYWKEKAFPIAQEALDQANLKPLQIAKFSTLQQLFPFIETPTPLQRYAIEQPLADGPQLFILEDVTGAGKTEAAMVLVHRMLSRNLADGLYVGLPTMATANAMYERLADCYRKLYDSATMPSLVLAHGARHLSEAFSQSVSLHTQPQDADYDNDEHSASAYCNAWVADNRKKALLAEIGVGTIDQALLAILPTRHQSLRLLGLGRKVLLVDEVHAYDPYMKKLLECLLEMHASQGGCAILLSATLPQTMKRDLLTAFARGRSLDSPILTQQAYPLATQFPKVNSQWELPVSTREEVARSVRVQRLADTDAVINRIDQAVKQGLCVCWIRNTVDEARQSYEDLRDRLGEQTDRVHLFHSRFAMQDRQRIETQVLKWFGEKSDHEMRKGRVLISTQVVEQSLDLDFDVLISDLAPIDLLLQRAGRLQRHVRDAFGNRLRKEGGTEQRDPAVLYVLAPEPTDEADESWLNSQRGTLAVYQDLGQLWRSARVLFEPGGYRMPEDARMLIELVYSPDTDLITPEAIELESYTADGQRRAAASMADLNMLNTKKGYTRNNNEAGWSEEVNVPTRLSDKTVSVVLVKPSENGGWQPYAEHPQFAWDFSILKMRDPLWRKAEQALSSGLKQEMEALQAEHKALKWHCLFPLVDQFVHWYDLKKGWIGVPADAGNGIKTETK
jgi:CRISPR-associated endonuclease/helicase Cas3